MFCRFPLGVTRNVTLRRHRVWLPSINSVKDFARSRRTFDYVTQTLTVLTSTFYQATSISFSLSEPYNDDQPPSNLTRNFAAWGTAWRIVEVNSLQWLKMSVSTAMPHKEHISVGLPVRIKSALRKTKERLKSLLELSHQLYNISLTLLIIAYAFSMRKKSCDDLAGQTPLTWILIII